MHNKRKGAIFIMPRSSKAWLGAEALWITVAGWSAAAKRRLGNAWVITTDRIAQPEEVIHYPLNEGRSVKKRNGSTFSKWIPLFFKTVLKDILLWRKSYGWNIISQQPWAREQLIFVWQQHDLFSGPGRKLATALKIPLVTYVHAPVVWESSKWGVKRFWWGWFLERFVEARSLKQSDIIACVSEEVLQKLVEMGVDRKKILVSPMAVDPFLFDSNQISPNYRKELGIENKFVVGWTGSFRSFHGLDLLVSAFNEIYKTQPNACLLLVGDGFERRALEQQVHELGLSEVVIFAGRQPFSKIPAYVSMFDIAVVSARSAQGFHYSPLKLREYLAAGKPVLAPHAGEIPQMFRDNFHLKLYHAGNPAHLTIRLNELIQNPELCKLLGKQGKAFALESNTWDFELRKLLENYMNDLL